MEISNNDLFILFLQKKKGKEIFNDGISCQLSRGIEVFIFSMKRKIMGYYDENTPSRFWGSEER